MGFNMAEFPYLPLWTDAYLADTIHLDCMESGAYLHLLICAWRSHDCSLPDDDKRLARFAKCSPRQWMKIKPTIMAFWTLSEHKWVQKRLVEERNFASAKRNQQSRAGKVSALKRKKTHSTDVVPPLQRNGNEQGNGTATPIPIPITISTKKVRTPHTPQGDECVSVSKSISKINGEECLQAVDIWNDLAGKHGLPKCQKLTPPRKSKLIARLKDCGGVDGWRLALEKVEQSPGLLGKADGNWKADFDFMLREARFTKLLEGGYDCWRDSTEDKFQNGFAEIIATEDF